MDVYKFPEIKQYWGMGNSIIKVNQITDAISYNKYIDISNTISIEDENYLIQLLCRQSI